MATIRPAEFPDFNVIGRQNGTKGELDGREFLTHSPPDLPPRHRILALLGTTDINDQASPKEDGWFVSDFYLFHYLLAPAFPQLPPAPNQIWLTCEDPERLVSKYKEYLHGDSQGDRRAVLDSQRLAGIYQAGNLRVVPRNILLERYLSTLQEQVAEASRLQEHLVLFIFGHGTPKYDVEVGGSILRIGDLRRVIRNRPQVTLFTTSCYSGGWLVIPDIRQQQLNVTAIAAAGPRSKSSSWPLSGSIGQASGSLAASAILRCLVDAEDDIQERFEHPTYIQLAKSIYDCVKGMGLLGDRQQIHFSAENDEWETSYQPRLGLPLMSYNEKWQSLRQVPPSTCAASSEVARAGGRRLKRLQYLAQEYFASNPGADNAAPNIGLHNCLKQVLNGASYPKEKVHELTEITAYRLGAMYEADYLREQMGLKFQSIFDMDPEDREHIIKTPLENQLALKTWSLLISRDINTTPIGIRRPYSKPLQYLTLALVDTYKSWEEIEGQVKAMADMKKGWYQNIYKAWKGHQIANDEGVRRNLRAFLEALKKIGH
ncbi:hypothetical protein N7468_007167 [Penicillium chermesinum]|uniref:Uncharacterized protein n=1 Tax=Penicillium chermesinum TaxID=63820 RepID=A0A9W9NTK1_9EURO|nr:uncharacterized protein N7468_007167 [Penicillium chermesinum]KAJ5225942.1 hypothetical protein N7468_007167 [Penicillium chermesinum]KAJ6160854.1 hypothetical protein N7470_004250 [Penicillium chermesinum]